MLLFRIISVAVSVFLLGSFNQNAFAGSGGFRMGIIIPLNKGGEVKVAGMIGFNYPAPVARNLNHRPVIPPTIGRGGRIFPIALCHIGRIGPEIG